MPYGKLAPKCHDSVVLIIKTKTNNSNDMAQFELVYLATRFFGGAHSAAIWVMRPGIQISVRFMVRMIIHLQVQSVVCMRLHCAHASGDIDQEKHHHHPATLHVQQLARREHVATKTTPICTSTTHRMKYAQIIS